MATRRDVLRVAGLAPILFNRNLFASGSKDFWETKPPSEWSSQEIDQLLTKSPWAKEAAVSFNGGPRGYGGNNGGGRRNGGGFPGGGIGFPGGGIGFPGGGGYPRGGGYPGGGYPGGGGGYPGGGQRGPEDRGRPQFHGTVRWESALPIRQALKLDGNSAEQNGSDAKSITSDFDKYYVIHLVGDLPAMGRRRIRNDEGDEDDRSSNEDAQNSRRMEMLKDNTRLERKEGFIRVERVEEGSRAGNLGPGTFFYFSRLDNISMNDKLVTFYTKMGPLEIRAKFTLKDMMYKGKLAI